MKSIFLTSFIITALMFNAKAQSKSKKPFYFCDVTKDTLTISELEKCFLYSSIDKEIKVKGFTVMTIKGGSLYQNDLNGNVFSRAEYDAIKKPGAFVTKVSITNIKYVQAGKEKLYKESVVFYIKKD